MVVRIHPMHPSLAGVRTKYCAEKNSSLAIEVNRAEDSQIEPTQSFDTIASWSEEKDIVIESLLDALHVHQLRRKDTEASTRLHETMLLHALALEYKHRSLFEKAMSCLNEALSLVEAELKISLNNKMDYSKVDSAQFFTASAHLSTNTSSKRQENSLNLQSMTSSFSVQGNPIRPLMEAKSKILTTMGNILKLQKNKYDAIISFKQALTVLLDAGYPDESSRVCMMLRLIGRLQETSTETER